VTRNLSFLLLAALSAAACGRSAGPPRTVPDPASLDDGLRRAYLKALAESTSGDAAAAARALAPLLLLRPVHVPSHLLHQDLARGAGAGEGLAEEYGALAKDLPSSADADLLLVRARGATLEERVTGYQAAAVKDPAAPWPRVALATARTELSRDLLRRASAKERDGFAEEGKRLRVEAKSSAERARTEAERGVALAPGLAAAHAALGYALGVAADVAADKDREKNEARAKALDAFGSALAIDPGDPRVLLGRATMLRDSGHQAEAAKDLDAAAEGAPRDPVILAARARNLQDLGSPKESADAWRAAAAAAPRDPDLRLDFGTALAFFGRWRDSLAEFRKADALYATGGGERWKARRGIVTALAQIGFDEQDPKRLAEALEELRAYRAVGGPANDWAAKMAELLGEETPAAEKPEKPPGPEGSEKAGK
jgi:Tfp pilus assembly protein PilF